VRAALAVEGSKRRALLTRTPRSAMAIVPSVTAAAKKTKKMVMGGRSGRHLLVPFCATIRHMAQCTKHRDTRAMAHHGSFICTIAPRRARASACRSCVRFARSRSCRRTRSTR
jgi:hypothetical protein